MSSTGRSRLRNEEVPDSQEAQSQRTTLASAHDRGSTNNRGPDASQGNGQVGSTRTIRRKIQFVVNFDGQKTTVEVPVDLKFSKIFSFVEKKFNIQPGTLRFTYDGERIRADDTAASLNMEIDDEVQAHLEQLGG